MKYEVLYDTLINKEHKAKGSEIEFTEGTDEGYIKRLLNDKIIAPLDEPVEEEEGEKTKKGKHKGAGGNQKDPEAPKE